MTSTAGELSAELVNEERSPNKGSAASLTSSPAPSPVVGLEANWRVQTQRVQPTEQHARGDAAAAAAATVISGPSSVDSLNVSR